MANAGSRRSASWNAAAADGYWKLWSSAMPRRKAGCASRAPELAKITVPNFVAPEVIADMSCWATSDAGISRHAAIADANAIRHMSRIPRSIVRETESSTLASSGGRVTKLRLVVRRCEIETHIGAADVTA